MVKFYRLRTPTPLFQPLRPYSRGIRPHASGFAAYLRRMLRCAESIPDRHSFGLTPVGCIMKPVVSRSGMMKLSKETPTTRAPHRMRLSRPATKTATYSSDSQPQKQQFKISRSFLFAAKRMLNHIDLKSNRCHSAHYNHSRGTFPQLVPMYHI